ncbi:uracil-DNA glycosylase [Pyrrhoderma noxium]|uniref:Uracil-DNA glycosylase n=1 Tax=Pyrrhoderma noxium TaxID=2282107 RepID=A0A286UA47_9AGAM|nr:uracil-DNA glycosylase [Pyrrhoderma noxium]
MADQKDSVDIVYLEDIEPKEIVKKQEDGDKEIATVLEKEERQSTTTIMGVKRQRTLMEMVALTPKSNSLDENGKDSEPSLKKQKVIADSKGASKAATGLQPLNSIPFSMQAFKDSLNEKEKELLALECETMGKSWLKLLKDEIKKPYFIELKKFLWSEGVKGPDGITDKIFPAPQNIYAWSQTPLGRVRVVIIGQDPYHGPGQAHGLSFSVPHGCRVPPSLRNIYAEIKKEYPEFSIPKHGNLTAWANEGVLLLNTALTVRNGNAGSHSKKGWETFTARVIDVVDKYGGANLGEKSGVGRGIVFLAWGNWAAKCVEKLDKNKHLILKSAHPSPLSASRGFLGNGHFKAANDWLEARYGKDGLIDWCTLDVKPPASE